MNLKYLFKAGFKNGTVYEENPEDKSATTPGKSCFYDIEQKGIENLKYFILKGGGHEYGVDLRDGHFEIDGIPFWMHENHVEKLPNGRQQAVKLTDFRVVFFRQHLQSIDTNAMTGQQGNMRHSMTYHFGWQCSVKCQNEHCPNFKNGQPHNYQHIMKLE